MDIKGIANRVARNLVGRHSRQAVRKAPVKDKSIIAQLMAILKKKFGLHTLGSKDLHGVEVAVYPTSMVFFIHVDYDGPDGMSTLEEYQVSYKLDNITKTRSGPSSLDGPM